eukprot:CCRYP_007535-RD/>CCRYP_007535-RD protein AED:0.31 eAED:0.31 QI:318/1/1/1/0.5/0.2/5/725/387
MVSQTKHKIGAAIIAIGVGLLFSPMSRQYALFRWLIYLIPPIVGLLPATTPRAWGYTFEQLQQVDLRGQVALVTGANSGIGFEIARALSRQGASVTMACRNPQRCFAAADRIRKEDQYSGAQISPLIMDVSDLSSVQRAAVTFLRNIEDGPLDMLFLNAGIFYDGHKEGATSLPLSKDGVEKTFATNVVGHHLLYRLLEPALQKSKIARVVSTSSVASIMWLPPYSLPYRFRDRSPIIPATLEGLNAGKPSSLLSFSLYGRSKLAQAVWSKALSKKRLGEQSTIYVNSVHPGAVYTPLATGKYFPSWMPLFVVDAIVSLEKRLLWTSEEGALTVLYLGTATDDIRSKNMRGRYYHPQSIEYDHPHAADEQLQDDVWNLCEELVKKFL